MSWDYKGEQFFLYDPEGDGMQYFKSVHERDQAARAAINGCLMDDTWSEFTDQIVVGVITASAQAVNVRHKPEGAIIDENGDDEDGVYWGDQERMCDYEMVRTMDSISELIWRVSHDEPGISHDRAEELASNFIDTQCWKSPAK